MIVIQVTMLMKLTLQHLQNLPEQAELLAGPVLEADGWQEVTED